MYSTSFICFLDLLGIKEKAKYSTRGYFATMKKFQRQLIAESTLFNEKEYSSESFVYFFSDCAFIQSDDLQTLISYLSNLRKNLIKDSLGALFFSAAISIGRLDAEQVSDDSLKDFYYEKLEKRSDEKLNVYGTIFKSPEISTVYLKQTEFKGVGIYIDPEVLEEQKKIIYQKVRNRVYKKIAPTDSESKRIELLEGAHNQINDEVKDKYEKFIKENISNSFFFPSVNTNTIKPYYDIKLSDVEKDSEATYDTIITHYYSSNMKNKKYGRFYLPYVANWINSVDIHEIEVNMDFNSKKKIPFLNAPLIINKLLGANRIITELTNSAHCFEYLLLFILNKLYGYHESTDSVTQAFIEKIIYKNAKARKLLNRIDEIPEAVLNLENKERLIKDCHNYLNN